MNSEKATLEVAFSFLLVIMLFKNPLLFINQ